MKSCAILEIWHLYLFKLLGGYLDLFHKSSNLSSRFHYNTIYFQTSENLSILASCKSKWCHQGCCGSIFPYNVGEIIHSTQE